MEYHINLRELEERGKKAADYKWDHEQRACGLMAQLAIAERLEAIAEVLQNLQKSPVISIDPVIARIVDVIAEALDNLHGTKP